MRLTKAVVFVLLVLPSFAYANIVPYDIVIESNKARAKEGLHLLVPDERLMAAAQARANDMANTGVFAHKGADGSSPWEWVREEGYSFSRAAENLAVNYDDAEAVIEGWLKSPGHRANLFDARLTDIGIGTAEGMHKGKSAVFVVQFLARPGNTMGQAAAVVQTSVEVIIEPGTESQAAVQTTQTAQLQVLYAQLQVLFSLMRSLFGA